jgi:hypothetical protein
VIFNVLKVSLFVTANHFYSSLFLYSVKARSKLKFRDLSAKCYDNFAVVNNAPFNVCWGGECVIQGEITYFVLAEFSTLGWTVLL